MERFEDKLHRELVARGKSFNRMEAEVGINHSTFSGKRGRGCHNRPTLMAVAYYLGITVEDLVAGTDMEDYWYGGTRERSV